MHRAARLTAPPRPLSRHPPHELMTDTTPRRERLDRAAANARVRRYRLRLAGVLPPLPVCPQCGGQVRATGPLCRRCWRLTDEGRAWNRERMRRDRSLVVANGDDPMAAADGAEVGAAAGAAAADGVLTVRRAVDGPGNGCSRDARRWLAD